jgi:nitroimidazol reductase NimA-like FMN-containing flavoprotein (pyridoxamine 5'-phosphate oxidase superfamily)
METYTPTARTQVKRLPKRGVYDRAQVHAILDAGFICHVGFAVEGQPYVIPTGYARSGDRIYIHGSAASRMLRSLGEGARFASRSPWWMDSCWRARPSIIP